MKQLRGNSIERYRQGEQAMARVVAISEAIRRADNARMGADDGRHLDSWDRSHRMDSDEVNDE